MGNSASSLPFSIGKQVSLVNDGWALHEGNRKSDGAEVSVFMAKKPTLNKTPINRREPNMTQLGPAKHHFAHCKKLRHPHILSVLATLDTDNPNDTAPTGIGSSNTSSKASESGDLIIVTEPCIPLEEWLQKHNPTPEMIAWGLESIVKALHFLHSSANQSHGNLSPSSFFVTKAGDVKLWNFSLITSISQGGIMSRQFIDWEGLITPDLYRSQERKEGRWDAIVAAGTHAMDSYGLGVLIGHLFNNVIPQKLVKAVQRLQTSNLKMRPRLQPLLKCPVFDTPYQKLQLQLEEFSIQPVEQKIAFWNNLTPSLQAGLIPELLAVYKILPIIKQTIDTVCNNDSMKSQDMYRRELVALLQPLFYIGETYLSKEDIQQLAPTYSLMFKIADRGVRGALLQKASFLEQNLDDATLNTGVFEPMCSGFSDSSPPLRELTLKATLVLVPHLTHPNLEKLARYLQRLQGDDEDSIRTNTVIFFSKLAPYLTEVTRQKMLLPAFMRAMKDPFTPCRSAALKSTLKAREFFDPKGIASRVMPAIAPALLDPSPEVRREAFAAIDDLLFTLRQESERMNSLPDPAQLQQQQQQQPPQQQKQMQGGAVQPPAARQQPAAPAKPPAPPSSTGGFSLGGISSWMGSSKKQEPVAPAPSSAPMPPVQAPPRPMVPSQPMVASQTTMMMAPPQPVNTGLMSGIGNLAVDDDDDNWDDDGGDGWDDDLDLSPGKGKPTMPTNTNNNIMAAASTGNNLFAPASSDDEDAFFDAFDKPAKPVVATRTMGASKLVVPKKTTTGAAKLAVKPVIKKLSVDDDVADGWDDF